MRTTGSLAALAALAFAASAQATTPNGGGLEAITDATCGGVTGTITHSQGPSFWFGDTHYVGTSFTFSDGTQSRTKDFGNKTGQGPSVTCVAQVGEGGAVSLTIEAVAVPD